MIKYTKEEFPPRFTIFEHKCDYCGIKFFSNRKKGKYDTGTCRTYDNKRKKTMPPLVPKPISEEELRRRLQDNKIKRLREQENKHR